MHMTQPDNFLSLFKTHFLPADLYLLPAQHICALLHKCSFQFNNHCSFLSLSLIFFPPRLHLALLFSFLPVASVSFLIFFPLPSLPAVGKWHVVRAPVWTGAPLGAMALPRPNSLAPVATWTSSLRLQRQQLPRSTPSFSIRKMDKPGSSDYDWTTAQQGPAV